MSERAHQGERPSKPTAHTAKARVERVAARPHWTRIRRWPLAWCDHDVFHHRDHERVERSLIAGREAKLTAHIQENVHESGPLGGGDVQVLMRISHRPTRVLLRSTCHVARQLCDKKFEARPLRREVPTRDHRIVVKDFIRHPAIHATVDERADSKHPSASRVQRAWDSVDQPSSRRHAGRNGGEQASGNAPADDRSAQII